jgi:hypothetical protein
MVTMSVDMSGIPPEMLAAWLLLKAGAMSAQHPLWQALCHMIRSSLGLLNPAVELSSNYSNLLEFMMSMQHVGGQAAVHLLNGVGGIGLGRGTQLQPHEFFQRHNFASISTRTLSAKQPAPELEGGISIRQLLLLLLRLEVRAT